MPDSAALKPVKAVSLRTIEEFVEQVPLADIVAQVKDMLEATLANDKPDWRAREIAVKLWLSYVVGLPIQRQEIVTHKINSGPTLKDLLATPGALDTVGAALSRLPARDRERIAGMLTERSAGASVIGMRNCDASEPGNAGETSASSNDR